MKLNSDTWLRLGCYLSLAISFMPIVDYYSPWYITLIPLAFTLLVTLRVDRNIFPAIVVVFVVLTFFLLTWWTIFYHFPTATYFVNCFVAFIPCLVALQLSRAVFDKRFFLDCLRVMTVFTGITSITTIIGLGKYPMASRQLASGTAFYDTLRYTRVNIGGYEFIYALVLLIPVLFWLIRNDKSAWKGVYICVLALNMYCIYKSQYTIALVCTVVAWIVVWMLNNRKAAAIFTIVLVAFLILDGIELLAELFYKASDIVGFDYVSDRLRQVGHMFSGQTATTETTKKRMEYYKQVLEAFGSSPIWGHNWFQYNHKYISGHTLILDMLGSAGIIGGAMLYVLIRKLYRMVINPRKKQVSPYIKATWTMAIIVASLNTVIFSAIMTIVFMCCMCINKIEAEETNETLKRRIGA